MNNCFCICTEHFDIWGKASGNSLCIHNTLNLNGVPPYGPVLRSGEFKQITFPLRSGHYLP
jgi:hypothetical protein